MQQWWRCHCILARLATYISISINADASYKHQRHVFCKYIWMWSNTTYSHCSFGHQVVSFQYSQLTTWYHILSKYVFSISSASSVLIKTTWMSVNQPGASNDRIRVPFDVALVSCLFVCWQLSVIMPLFPSELGQTLTHKYKALCSLFRKGLGKEPKQSSSFFLKF